MKFSFGLLACGIALVFSSAAATTPWSDIARRLTGESERVRNQSVAALRARPHLEEELRSAWGTSEQFLAYDVMVALGLRKMVPALIEFSSRDETGYAYHTLNALASGEERIRLLEIYRKRLEDKSASPLAKIVFIDSLARTSVALPPGVLRRLLDDPFPEVRGATLGYFRNSILQRGRLADLEILEEKRNEPAATLRIQEAFLLGEITPQMRTRASSRELSALKTILSRCRTDVSDEVRALCVRKFEETFGAH